MSASSAVAYRSRTPLAALADPVGTVAALAADPGRDADRLHRAVQLRSAPPSGQLRMDVADQQLAAARVRRGRPDRGRAHARPRSLRRRRDRALQHHRRVAHARRDGKHARVEPDRARDRSRRRADQRRAGRLRKASADPRHAGDALDLRRARDQGPAGAGRARSHSPTRRSSPTRSRRGASSSSAS